MKNLTKLFLVAILIFWGQVNLPAFAQDNKKEIKRLETDAKELFRIGEYMNALPLYQRLDSMSPGNGFYNLRIGICYYNSIYKRQALSYLMKVPHSDDANQEVFYYLARAFHLNHNFDSAEVYYKKFRKVIEANPKVSEIPLKDVNRYIENCTFGRELMANALTELYIENLGPTINSKYSDYSPVISADETELIFTSRRPDTQGGSIDPYTNQYFEDLYITTRDEETFEWNKPKNMGSVINTKDHDATIGLSADGLELYMYRSNSTLGSGASGSIYFSDKVDGDWTSPKKMQDGINSPNWEPSASITTDEKILYFSSNRPGGFGGLDIYMVRKLPNGEWAQPQNLGPTVNTEYDEDGPFIHPDANNNTLYFSSKGHKSMGGFDVFTTKRDLNTNQWSEPRNIGYPINSADDDIYFVWSADATRGYFSSVREDSYGDLDIYVINLPEQSVNVMIVKGRILDDDSDEPVKNAIITVRDNDSNDVVGVYNSDAATGNFKILLPLGKNYAINIDATNYLFYSENIHLPDDNTFTQVIKDIRLSHIVVGKISILRNLFFDLNSSQLRNESNPELDKVVQMLKDNTRLVVEIAGHTDNTGNYNYNKELSRMRAKSVVDYLVSKGIDSARLFAFGYGQDFPIVENFDDESRQLNRRTELIILDGKRAEDMRKRHIGYYNEMKAIDPDFTLIGSQDIRKVLKGRQFEYKKPETEQERLANAIAEATNKAAKDSIAEAERQNEAVAMEKRKKEELAEQKRREEESKKIKLDDESTGGSSKFYVVRFDFAKSTPTQESARELFNLLERVKSEKDIQIVLKGHTDNVGSKEYNLILSEQRAKSVKKYLVDNGIESNRITIESYAFEKPVESNNTTAGRSKNRRVEIEVGGKQ